VVAVLFGAAVAAAVPVYLGFQSRKADKAARAHLVAAVPVAEAYRADHGSYARMDAVDLLQIDPRVPGSLTVVSAHRRTYCLSDSVHGMTWSLEGPYRGDAPLTPNGTCT
jgi:Tfp pilus assembly protein PilE